MPEQHPSNQTGIHFSGATNLTLERVQVQAYGGCVNHSNPTGACHNPCTAPGTSCHNIWGEETTGVAISDARLEGGSTGVELRSCEGAVLSRVAVRNVRGPYPRGQCVQFSHSDGATLQNFTCVNEETQSWTEDAISAWRSSDVTIRQGIVDGNNSPHGIGVMFEGSESATHGGLVEDVDAIHQGGGRGGRSRLPSTTPSTCCWPCGAWALAARSHGACERPRDRHRAACRARPRLGGAPCPLLHGHV